MLVRKCAQDHNVVIHLNNKPGMAKKISDTKTLTYPNSKKYFLVVDDEIKTKSDSFQTIELAYVAECAKLHESGHGRIDIVKHKLINNKVVER
tara:strand:- start:5475 stop:5753 length:279 start_codon:yes stop_codon:yes gene_type:complete